MRILFSESFDNLSKFIFNFYDFNKDGLISKEEVRTVLSYVPLNTKTYGISGQLKYEKYITPNFSHNFEDRVESQEELHNILKTCFKDTDTMDYKRFLYILENVCSDIYLFLLIFLLQNKPFTNSALGEYEKQKTSFLKVTTNTTSLTSSPGKLLASPNLNSKFSPSVAISKSPVMNSQNSLFRLDSAKEESKNFLMKFAGGNTGVNTNLDVPKRTDQKSKTVMNNHVDINLVGPTVPVNRKVRNNLKNIEEVKPRQKDSKNEYEDLPIFPAAKVSNANITPMDVDDEYEEDDKGDIIYEGHLYKISEDKTIKKLWFKLINRDLYCKIFLIIVFKSSTEKVHAGMHNLSGVFLQEDSPQTIEGNDFFTFSVVYPKKTRHYYVDNPNDFRGWVSAIKRATGFTDLNDLYEVKEKLGNGKFGLVRLGIHKITGRKVAIKIMNKKDMTNQDLELVKTEIDTLKICQHPNIIKLYDVFENVEYIYLSKDIYLSSYGILFRW
jgi:hypothetical protein